jgi:hypothetical protein
MDENLKAEVLDVLPSDSEEAMSATAISKEVGYSKTNKNVQEILAELFESGEIESETSTRGYDVYWKPISAKGSSKSTSTSKAVKEITYVPPKNNFGYTFSISPKGYTVSTPDRKTIELEGNDRLLVLNNNNNYRFIVNSPEDIISAIGTFTTEQNIGTYLVTNMETGGSITGIHEIDERVAGIFLTISKHNKAGL